MNSKALLQLGAELLFQFRHSNNPADREIATYISARRFLGAKDKGFLSDCFFHTLRHLRRYDEAILSAFAGTIATETRYSAGFPITSEIGARPWLRRESGQAVEEQAKSSNIDRAIDTIRLGIAAVELQFETAPVVAEELIRFWPNVASHVPVQSGSLTRMMERTVEVAALYKQPKKILDEDRAFSFPSWLWVRLAQGRQPKEMRALGEALNQQAPIAMRVNTLKTTVDAAEAALREAGNLFEHGKLAPDAIVLSQRIARASLPHTEDGWFEVQDEGSQLVGVYTGVQPGMTVIDACAGGGGKSLHLAAMMKNEGRISVFDLEPVRLANLAKRAVRAGVTISDDSIKLDKNGSPRGEVAPAELVLIDAPCSGLGTLRRAPDIRWRLTTSRLEQLKRTQRELLDRWAHYVKPGGMLVYATCSLLAEENELQIDSFLAANKDWSIAPPPAGFPVPLTARGELKLSPAVQGCDGFYAVRIQKK